MRRQSRSRTRLTLDRISWKETLSRLRADRARLRAMLADQQEGQPFMLSFHPAFVCVFLHRISHYCFRRGHRHVARFFWHLNVALTGADISAPADIGEGLLVPSPAGAAITAKAGRNLTVMPLAGIGSELGRRQDIGAGPGLPVLGDDVVLEPMSGVLGPVRIGSRVRVAAGAIVIRDVPDDALVVGPEPRFLTRSPLP